MAKEKDDTIQIHNCKKNRLLDKGGLREVWLVEEEKTGKQMVVKLMLPETFSNEIEKHIFLRSSIINCQLIHQNLVHYYKWDCSCDIYYMLMEYCSGGSVDDLMKKNGGKLSIETANHIILQILNGLHYIHNATIIGSLADGRIISVNGVIHCNIKPKNILLSDTSLFPVAKLTGIELSKDFQTERRITDVANIGEIIGTLPFMPRQQMIYYYQKQDVDVWAVAASYYYMLTGKFPRDYKGRSFGELVYETLKKDPIPIQKRNPQIPDSLAKVIDTALMDNPEIGIKSALELKKAIENAL